MTELKAHFSSFNHQCDCLYCSAALDSHSDITSWAAVCTSSSPVSVGYSCFQSSIHRSTVSLAFWDPRVKNMWCNATWITMAKCESMSRQSHTHTHRLPLGSLKNKASSAQDSSLLFLPRNHGWCARLHYTRLHSNIDVVTGVMQYKAQVRLQLSSQWSDFTLSSYWNSNPLQ